MAFFKRYPIIIISIASCVVSFAVSIWMHDKVYGKKSPSFARLRGGPAVGTALGFAATFVNLEALRVQADPKCLSTNEIILAESMAFLSVGSGVILADMRRGWKGKEKK